MSKLEIRRKAPNFSKIHFGKGKKLHWLRHENLTLTQISLGLFWSKSDQFRLFGAKESDYLHCPTPIMYGLVQNSPHGVSPTPFKSRRNTNFKHFKKKGNLKKLWW